MQKNSYQHQPGSNRDSNMNKTHRWAKRILMLLCICTLLSISINTLLAQDQGGRLAETYDTLKNVPAGAVELTNGIYQSVMLKKPCPFRVFSPIDPKWPALIDKNDIPSKGMNLIVYVMNLNGVPRPSAAPDRLIIEDLIKDGFLVVAVDFAGGKIVNPLEMQKDINGMFCMFGGEWNAQQGYFTKNRKTLLEYPSPNAGSSYTSFDYSRDGRNFKIPINRGAIYVIPSGYTVKTHQKIKEIALDDNDINRFGFSENELFIDIIYPKPSNKTEKVPLLLEACSNGSGRSVINANTVILYSWPFNGYALASMSFCGYIRYNTMIHALRYLQSKRVEYSLSGKMGTAGISKACLRCYNESNFKNQKCDADDEPYGKESNQVEVCMPAVGEYPKSVYENLDKNSPALLLSWNPLNDPKDTGDLHRSISEAYKKAGIEDKCLYLSSPLAGHEYDVYHLNEIMSFFDRFCK